MILNPFVEGVIAVVLGIGCIVLSHVANAPELSDTGKLLTGVGLGYLGHSALVAPPPAK